MVWKWDTVWEWDTVLEWDMAWEWDTVLEWDMVWEWDYHYPLGYFKNKDEKDTCCDILYSVCEL